MVDFDGIFIQYTIFQTNSIHLNSYSKIILKLIDPISLNNFSFKFNVKSIFYIEIL